MAEEVEMIPEEIRTSEIETSVGTPIPEESSDRSPEDSAQPQEGILTTWSRGISWVLHPFLVPAYTICILLFGDTIMGNIALSLKWFFVLVVVLNTLIGDLSLQQRRERIIPLAVVAVCYLICALMISNVLVAFLIRKFLFAALGCVIMALVVNFWWKISLHLTAAGGAVAMLLIVAISRFGDLTGTVIVAILLSGSLASARLWLGSHTPAQVAAGFFGGFAAASLVMLAL